MKSSARSRPTPPRARADAGPAVALPDRPAGAVAAPPAEEARRALMDAIQQLPLAAHFGRAALKEAGRMARGAQHWHKPLAWYRPGGGRGDALQCAVTDEGRLLRVSVFLYPLFGQLQVASECGCGQPLCAHAAALMLRLQQLLDWPRAMSPLERWRHSLAMHEETAAAPAAVADAVAPRQLVCLLETVDEQDSVRLAARLVLVPAVDGLAQPHRWIAADQARARPHLSRQALMWQAQLALGRRRSGKSEQGYFLQGHGGAALLAEWLEAGLCHHAHGLRPLVAGAPRQPPWRWRLDARGRAVLELAWEDGRELRPIELDALYYLDEHDGRIGRLELGAAAWAMARHMPPADPRELDALRADWPPHPLLSALPAPPPAPPLRELRAPLRPVAVLGASRHALRGDYVFHLQAWADYGGLRLPLADEPWRAEWVRMERDGLVAIRRDVEAEMQAGQALAALGLVGLGTLVPEAWRQLAPPPPAAALGCRELYQGGAETFTALEARLQALGNAGIRLEYDAELPFTVLPHEPRFRATLAPGEGGAWTQFELAATLDNGEEIDVLPIVLGGLARREFALAPAADEPPDAHWLAPLGHARWLPLRLAWLREWMTPLLECLHRPGRRADAAGLDLSRSQAMALSDALRQQGIPVEGPQAADIAGALAALREALAAPAPALPAGFRGQLRHYQREGLQWLQALRRHGLGGVLADDMGLGKTVQVIAHLLLEDEAGRLDRPALIVAPTSLVFNWLDEIARFAPSLRRVNFTGPARAARLPELPGAHVIVTSYALLANDVEALEKLDYAMLVLDEAQWIKNPLTRTARAVRRLRAPHRLAVTGTPLENHLGELWAHFDAVLPGYLGDYRSFNRSFRLPIERHGDDARGEILRRRIAPFLLRRRKAEVAPELPAKTETVLRVAMGEAQRRVYESLRLAMNARVREALASYGAEQSRVVVLSALLRLRQACCDPRLLDLPEPPPSAKLDALLELVQALREEERQVLVFSQFTSMLALLSAALEKAGLRHALLTGDTTDRAEPVRRFQQRETPILLASLKAGGVGLNLTAADAVIHYDPWWNPAVEQQAVDRAHRLGREQPVFVYKLLCEDTIEDKIEAMKTEKSDLAGLLLDAADAPGALDARDLRALFDLPAP